MSGVLPDPSELVEVYRTGRRFQAELVRSLLESNGIEAAIFGSGLDAAYPGAFEDARVMVTEHDVERARELILEAEQAPSGFD